MFIYFLEKHNKSERTQLAPVLVLDDDDVIFVNVISGSSLFARTLLNWIDTRQRCLSYLLADKVQHYLTDYISSAISRGGKASFNSLQKKSGPASPQGPSINW